MPYQPTAEDFADINDNEKYTPSAKDFEQEPTRSKPLELELIKNSPKKQTTGWGGLAEDAYNLLRDALKSSIDFGSRVPENLKEIGSELLHHPLSYPPHVAQQILAGLGEGVKGLANIPHEIFDELANKEITPNWLRTGSIPEDTGLEKFLGLEPTKKSDELLRALPAIYGAGKLVAQPLGAAKRKLTAPSKETLFQRALEKRIDEAAKNTAMSEEQLKNLKDSLRLDYSKIHQSELGETTPIGQEVAINVKEGKLKKLKPATEIAEQEVGEIPEAPDTETMIAKSKEARESAREATENKLGIKENPQIAVRSKIKKAIKQVKSNAEDLYNKARAYYQDKDVKVDNSAEIKSLGKELEELSANENIFEGTASERDALNKKIKSLEEETINATDLFDLQRTLETMADNVRSKQFAEKVPELERKHLGKIAQRLDASATQLEKRLESVGGKDVQKIMSEANQGWRTYKQLTKENPVGKAAIKGNVPTDSLIKLADEYPANDFLKALVDSDAELKKNLLAIYTGENGVNSLMKPSTAIKNVLQSLPEVEEHVQALKNAISNFKTDQRNVNKIKKEHKELVDSMKKAAQEQKIRRDAIEESNKIKSQIQFHKDAIPKLEAKMKAVDEHSAEHARLKKELSDHKKHIKDKNYLLKKITGVILKTTGVSTLMHKIGL